MGGSLNLLTTPLTVSSPNQRFERLNIFSSNTVRETAQSGSDPTDIPDNQIDVYGANTTFAGCTIHDLKQFGLWQAAPGSHLIDCHLFNIGWNAPDRGHGHLLYGQGVGAERVIENCIFGQTFAYGAHLYGSSPSFDNWTFRNCIFFSNPNIVGGTPGVDLVDHIKFENCVFFDAEIDYGYQSVNLGTLTLTDNTYLDTTKVVSVHWNTVSASGETTDPASLSSWVFACDTAPKVAHIAVWNPAEQATAIVNIGSIPLINGVSYRLRNAYDSYNDTETFIYDGSGEITVTFTGRTVALPTGYASPLATIDARFGCWTLETV